MLTEAQNIFQLNKHGLFLSFCPLFVFQEIPGGLAWPARTKSSGDMREVGLFLVFSCEVLQMKSRTPRNVSLLTLNLPSLPPLVVRVQVSRAGLGWAGLTLERRGLTETMTWSRASQPVSQ